MGGDHGDGVGAAAEPDSAGQWHLSGDGLLARAQCDAECPGGAAEAARGGQGARDPRAHALGQPVHVRVPQERADEVLRRGEGQRALPAHARATLQEPGARRQLQGDPRDHPVVDERAEDGVDHIEALQQGREDGAADGEDWVGARRKGCEGREHQDHIKVSSVSTVRS